MNIEGKLVNELASTTPIITDISLSTDTASPTILKRTTWQAIYNLFKGLLDTAYNSTYARLSGGNTFSGNQNVTGRISSTQGVIWGNSDNKGAINLNTLLTGGEYVTEPGSTNIPIGADTYGYVTVRNYGGISGYTQQEYSNLGGGVNSVKWIRKMDAGVWGNWTKTADGSAWTSFTPTLIGDTGSATIGTVQFCKIQPRGKQLEIVGRFSFTKNTMSGIIKMGVPGYTFAESTLKVCIADQGSSTLYNPLMLGQAGGSYITFEKQMAINTIVASDLGAGTIWLWFNGTLELA